MVEGNCVLQIPLLLKSQTMEKALKHMLGSSVRAAYGMCRPGSSYRIFAEAKDHQNLGNSEYPRGRKLHLRFYLLTKRLRAASFVVEDPKNPGWSTLFGQACTCRMLTQAS